MVRSALEKTKQLTKPPVSSPMTKTIENGKEDQARGGSPAPVAKRGLDKHPGREAKDTGNQERRDHAPPITRVDGLFEVFRDNRPVLLNGLLARAVV